MYVGSILHDLGHGLEQTDHHNHHGDSHDVQIDVAHADDHSDVACFFCSHSQALTDDITVQQTWTLSTASLAPPIGFAGTPRSASVLLSELRGPPAV